MNAVLEHGERGEKLQLLAPSLLRQRRILLSRMFFLT